MNDGFDVKSGHEALSALADGEVRGAGEVEAALAHWRGDEQAREAWRLYHTIGDVMRSEDLAAHARGDEAFLASFRERLAAEPVVLAPAASAPSPASTVNPALRIRRQLPVWMATGAAAAGVVAVAAVAAVLWAVQGEAPEDPGTLAAATGRSAVPGFASVAPDGAGPGSHTVSLGVSGPASRPGGAGSLESLLRVHRGAALVPAPVRLEAEGWAVQGVPRGFELQGAVRRLAEGLPPGPDGALPQQLQAVYANGAQRVSLFIEPLRPGQPREAMAWRAGPTTVWMQPHGEHVWVTVAGEVPLETLQAFAVGLRRR